MTVMDLVKRILFKERQPWYYIISQMIFLMGLLWIFAFTPTLFGIIETTWIETHPIPLDPISPIYITLWGFAGYQLSLGFILYLVIVLIIDVIYPLLIWVKKKVFY